MREQVKEKAQDRLEILDEIEKLEREGKFDVDPEKDPPTIVLTPENVDYLKTKSTSKIKRRVAQRIGERFLDEILRTNKLIIKDINGIENLNNIKTGAIITCNHFNPFDSFSVEKVFRMSGLIKEKKLFKVIREGNYTNFPGFYGFLFRNCDTLPLSSNTKTMVQFMKSVKIILDRGDFILIYPEQSLWWNYRKPKPLKNGAFKIGNDGFPVQEYIINISEPIYPDENLSELENQEMMKQKNYEIWKNIYEDFYKIPLEYTTENKEQLKELIYGKKTSNIL